MSAQRCIVVNAAIRADASQASVGSRREANRPQHGRVREASGHDIGRELDAGQ
jgi:hypothetical protein